MVKITSKEYGYEKEDELASARVAFADAIGSADNFDEILITMNHLFISEVEKTLHAYASGKKSEAKRLKHTTDEIFTIMMCAVYRSQEKRNR